MTTFAKLFEAMLSKQTTPTWGGQVGPARYHGWDPADVSSYHGWDPADGAGYHGWDPADVTGYHGWDPR